MYDSSGNSNSISDKFDTRKSLLTKAIFSDSNPEGEIPVIESITVSPNPSTKGDKVILNIAVTYKNSSGLKYSWSEVGELVVSLNGADTASPSFIAPHVRWETNVTFCVTVTNEIGRTSYGNITAKIQPSNTAGKNHLYRICSAMNSQYTSAIIVQHIFYPIYIDPQNRTYESACHGI